MVLSLAVLTYSKQIVYYHIDLANYYGWPGLCVSDTVRLQSALEVRYARYYNYSP